jgi:hypothetical protein
MIFLLYKKTNPGGSDGGDVIHFRQGGVQQQTKYLGVPDWVVEATNKS